MHGNPPARDRRPRRCVPRAPPRTRPLRGRRGGSRPSRRAARYPALNASPAPTGSTSSPAGGRCSCHEPSVSRTAAPAGPRLSTISLGPSRVQARARAGPSRSAPATTRARPHRPAGRRSARSGARSQRWDRRTRGDPDGDWGRRRGSRCPVPGTPRPRPGGPRPSIAVIPVTRIARASSIGTSSRSRTLKRARGGPGAPVAHPAHGVAEHQTRSGGPDRSRPTEGRRPRGRGRPGSGRRRGRRRAGSPRRC